MDSADRNTLDAAIRSLVEARQKAAVNGYKATFHAYSGVGYIYAKESQHYSDIADRIQMNISNLLDELTEM